MSVYQGSSALRVPLHTNPPPQTTGQAEEPVQQLLAVRPSLFARVTGLGRRVRRTLTQPDACDMTPECAASYHEAFARLSVECDMENPDARQSALESCIPLLFNIRVPSARAQYLRHVACYAHAYAKCPEQFMRQMLPHIESYGRGLSPREVLQAAGL